MAKKNKQMEYDYSPIRVAKYNNNASATLDKWADIIKVDAYDFLEKIMKQAKQVAKSNLRRNGNIETGALEESIDSKATYVESKKGKGIWAGVGINRKTRKEKKFKKLSPEIRVPVYYAHLIERGFTHLPDGKKVEAKPFLMPAVNSTSGGDRGIQQSLDKIVANAKSGIPNKFETIKMDFYK